MELRKNIGRICLLLVLVFSLAIGSSYAQRLTGKLMGTVTDDEGILLPGVTVEISSPALMGVRAQVTSDKGIYRFINLSPGVYKAVFKLEGFQTMERENLRISLGTTVTENIVIKPSALEETITVTAESPIVDVTKSGLSSTFDKDLLEKIPSGRFTFLDVIKQAPGIQQVGQDSDRNVAFGSNMESNAYYLDGVDISNPDIGIVWHWINADIFEEVETSGIGLPAEYGQFTGAVVNIVTKSGGNTFNGSISYYGQFDRLTDDNNPQPEEAYSYQRHKFYYLTFNLGGPIVKDRVWFFASYEKSKDSVSFWNQDPDYPATWPADKYFFKLSTQITSKHKLVGSFYYEVWEDPDIKDPWTEKEALANEIGTTPTWNVMYTWLISNDAYFELKYAGYTGDDTYEPMHSDYDTSAHYDGYTGVYSEGVWWPWFYVVSRHQANASLSYFAEDFLGGDHDFKIGVQLNRGTSDCHGGYAGGRAYYDYYGDRYYMYEQDVYAYGGVVNSMAAFVDDSWKIGERITLNLGFRYDHSNGSIPSYPVYDGWDETGEMNDSIDDLIVWNTFSPRIGIAFQLTSDQKTLLKATYGRYYDANYTSNWIWPGPNATDWKMFLWDLEFEEWILWDYLPGGMAYNIDPKLKNPYADQFSIGLERELLPDFSLGATLIYKIEKNLLGWEDRGATYEQISLVAEDGQSYNFWNQTSDLPTNEYWITNPQDYEQTYWAAIFTLRKRYSNNWMLNASLAWSKNEGLNMMGHSSFQQAMIWYAGDFGKDPNDLINAKGILANDRTWIIKFQAGYTFPWDIWASINYIYQTGRPKMKFVRVFGLNQDPWDLGKVILAEPRSSDNRHPDCSMLDIRLQKTIDIYKTLKIHAILDVFNVFNSNTTTDYASFNTWAENYLEVEDIFYPRRVQIGLRLEF